MIRNSSRSSGAGRPGVPAPSDQLLEVRLGELLARHGSGLFAQVGRCEALIRDLCGEKIKEAHLLIQALQQQVPADLIGMPRGSSPLPTLRRLQKRLEDALGLAPSAAHWAVNAWGQALGIVADEEFLSGVAPEAAAVTANLLPGGSSAFVPAVTLTLKEIVADPAAYEGRTIRVRGLNGGDSVWPGHFDLTQGKLLARVAFGHLPREQKAMVRRDHSKGTMLVVEGIVGWLRDEPWITAANVTVVVPEAAAVTANLLPGG